MCVCVPGVHRPASRSSTVRRAGETDEENRHKLLPATRDAVADDLLARGALGLQHLRCPGPRLVVNGFPLATVKEKPPRIL